MTLDETTTHLSEKYLGHAGIHGIGLARTKHAVKVYVSVPGAAPTTEQRSVLKQLKAEAAPYKVELTYEKRAQACV